MPTAANTSPSGESAGASSVAAEAKPNTPNTIRLASDRGVGSSGAADMAWATTETVCGSDGPVPVTVVTARGAAGRDAATSTTARNGGGEKSGRDGAAFLVAVTVLASMPCASAVLSTSFFLLSEPALGPPAGAADDRLFDDHGAAAVAGPEPIALDGAAPLRCALALRGSSDTVDPVDVVAVIPVELLDAGPEVKAPTEEPLDGGSSE
ncbi:MAG: hypothetical protein ACXVGO_13835 [Mycobacterium sp.]